MLILYAMLLKFIFQRNIGLSHIFVCNKGLKSWAGFKKIAFPFWLKFFCSDRYRDVQRMQMVDWVHISICINGLKS